jgi:SOS-response transcriptional repressor LexA
MASAGGAFSWNSELPSGRSPFWIRDEALAGLGLHTGDAVSVDTRAEAIDGDLVVAEVEQEGDSRRIARRYFLDHGRVRLEPVGDGEVLELEEASVMVMGVIAARLVLQSGAEPTEVPLDSSDSATVDRHEYR